MAERICNCGSGEPSYWLHDAANIPVARVCERCEHKVKRRYNPAIFENGAYAAYGTEEALEADDYRWEGI